MLLPMIHFNISSLNCYTNILPLSNIYIPYSCVGLCYGVKYSNSKLLSRASKLCLSIYSLYFFTLSYTLNIFFSAVMFIIMSKVTPRWRNLSRTSQMCLLNIFEYLISCFEKGVTWNPFSF